MSPVELGYQAEQKGVVYCLRILIDPLDRVALQEGSFQRFTGIGCRPRNVSKVDYSVQSVGGGGLEHREG